MQQEYNVYNRRHEHKVATHAQSTAIFGLFLSAISHHSMS